MTTEYHSFTETKWDHTSDRAHADCPECAAGQASWDFANWLRGELEQVSGAERLEDAIHGYAYDFAAAMVQAVKDGADPDWVLRRLAKRRREEQR